MDKLSSDVDCQFCNRKVEKSRYLDHLRDTHEYTLDRFLKSPKMDKLSSDVDCQFCNRKVEKSRYLDHLRDTHEYTLDRFLKVIVCPVFECNKGLAIFL
uniref:C2H2-type domain-containing protein n=1 Tax=Strongyloides venezuelensis TaxID=75913 RepID=A0A0K0FG51_STRVS